MTAISTTDVGVRNDALEQAYPFIKAASRRWAGYARTDPDDLVQEASVRFLSAWPTYDPTRGSVVGFGVYCTYAAAVGRRKYATALARRAEAKAVPAREGLDADRRSPDPARLAELADELASLQAAMWELPRKYTGYLVARYCDDLGHAEIADQRGIDVSLVQSKLAVALGAVRRKLGVTLPGRRKPSPKTPQAMKYRAKRIEAAALRRAGATAEEVAARLGVTNTFVYEATSAEAAPAA